MPRKQSNSDADPDVLVFRASLAPKLFRDFEVGAGCTLYDLALAIVTVFDFDFDHAFGFYSNLKGDIYASPVSYELSFDMGEGTGKARSVKRTRAADAFPNIGRKMRFLFDYGDGWELLIEFKTRKPKEPRVKLPRLVLSMGQAPEQYPSLEDHDEDDED